MSNENQVISLDNKHLETLGDIHIWRHSEPKSAKMFKHLHTYNELEIIISGEGVNEFAGLDIPVGKGSVYIIPPFISHRVNFHSDFEIITIAFSDKTIKYPKLLKELKAGTIYCDLSPQQLEYAQKIIQKICNATNSNAAFSKEEASSLFNALIIEFLKQSKSYNPYEFNSSIPTKLKNAIAYINNNVQKDISLADVAETVGLTPNYLSALFKKHLGVSYIDFICGIRLDQAKILMSDNELTISQISRMIGFNSASYFTERFKAQFGISPNSYRNENK